MNTQRDNMFDTWNRFQEQWWTSWSEAAAKTPEHDRSTASPYMNWQDILDWSMKAQAEWTRLLMNSTSPQPGGSMPVVQWEEQLNLLMKFWTDAQRQTLESWLKMVTDLNTVASSPAWAESMKNMIESWHKLSQDVLDTQEKLLSSYEQAGHIKKQAGSGAKTKKAATKDVA